MVVFIIIIGCDQRQCFRYGIVKKLYRIGVKRQENLIFVHWHDPNMKHLT